MLVQGSVFCQNLNDEDMGDQAYRDGDYYLAVDCFKKVYNKQRRGDIQVGYKLAQAYRQLYNYKDAENVLTAVVKKDTRSQLPLAWYYLGEMQKNNMKYDSASTSFAVFLEKYGEKKDYFYSKAKQEIESCRYAAEHFSDSNWVAITHLNKKVNTPFSDFGAIQLGDSMLIYTSQRTDGIKDFETLMPDIFTSKLYYSLMGMRGYTSGKELGWNINDLNYNTANFTMDKETGRIYFSYCPTDKDAGYCQIYFVERKNGRWTKPQKLEDGINLPDYNSTQPHIAKQNGETLLYFVSDRKGGFGQKDIWYSIYKNGRFQIPINAGYPINTQGNEITPFYSEAQQALYFSSDWHKGFGGYDIFRCKGSRIQWTSPENLGRPINSSANDMYFSVTDVDTLKGYLTSNRMGSYHQAGETCCNDIYAYTLTPKPDTTIIADTTPKPDIKNIVREFLPLSLYFHNDEPDPATMAVTTKQNYAKTLDNYMDLKDKYIQEYSRGLKGQEKEEAAYDIEKFFALKVENSFFKLEKLSELLLLDLQKGNTITLTIKGFASPLNTPEYNMNLAQRRISSLLNYWQEYQNGALVPYMDAHKLIIKEDPLGSTLASKKVSNSRKDIRNSVYSPLAAEERKIQILYYDAE